MYAIVAATGQGAVAVSRNETRAEPNLTRPGMGSHRDDTLVQRGMVGSQVCPAVPTRQKQGSQCLPAPRSSVTVATLLVQAAATERQ